MPITSPTSRGIPDPPAELAALIGGSLDVGRTHISTMRRFSGLRADDRILDIGSGVGRTAMWLSSFLTEGSYEGLEIHADSVAWCQREISSRYPNFCFQHVDL